MPKPSPQPKIIVSIEGQEPKSFDHYGQAAHFLWDIQHALNNFASKVRANEIAEKGVKYIWEARLVFEHKFDIWVAQSKGGKYNLRRKDKWSYTPFVFCGKKMFGLTGKQLLAFYHRYAKVAALE